MTHRPEYSETRRSVMILGISALALAGGAFSLPLLRSSPRDPRTSCLPGPTARLTLVLVDRTDPWSQKTATLLVAHLKRLAEDAAPEERLSLFAFSGQASPLPEAVFDRCKLPRAGNILNTTPQRVERDYTAQFAGPLVEAHRNLAQSASAPRTELVEAIAALLAKARLEIPGAALTLHVFSDMDENSAGYSFARRLPVQAFVNHFAAHLGPRLDGAALHIHLLPPPHGLQVNAQIERAWRAALQRHAARFTWEPL